MSPPFGSSYLFQSTHSQGVRLNSAVEKAVGEVFQSTHSQGVRP
ncbi:Hypothetical cytosolic protein [Lactobacillus helveticus H10]|nr:Hypothetical cytosolic protein [Lactobacillus helveticus H10]